MGCRGCLVADPFLYYKTLGHVMELLNDATCQNLQMLAVTKTKTAALI